MSKQITPEQRTEHFFNAEVDELKGAFEGRLIVSGEEGKMIRVDSVEAWVKEAVGKKYHKRGKNLSLLELSPGTMEVFPLPVRRMRQSLISARSGGELGACIRLVRASRFDPDAREFIRMPREGDIADYFELEDNEAVRLRFLDDSEILYFFRGKDTGVRATESGMSPNLKGVEIANKYLRDLIS